MTTPDPAGVPPEVATLEAAGRLLTDARGEITRADSKAAVLAGALGVTVGVLSGFLTAGRLRPWDLGGLGSVLWWAGACCAALALLSLLMAILPRYRPSTWAPGLPLTYFADTRRASSQGLLAQALADTARSPAEALLVSLAETSRIVADKHRWIRIGLAAFFLSALFFPTAGLLG
ncbi:Pycsar system effector family protein [Streptomyces sp. NPDC005794]|uniref:Pycsar system effector family protein n=1 Tax=Streptomyces sp. NPDC005794 TaxID=3364733 RepID=UPI00368677C2